MSPLSSIKLRDADSDDKLASSLQDFHVAFWYFVFKKKCYSHINNIKKRLQGPSFWGPAFLFTTSEGTFHTSFERICTYPFKFHFVKLSNCTGSQVQRRGQYSPLQPCFSNSDWSEHIFFNNNNNNNLVLPCTSFILLLSSYWSKNQRNCCRSRDEIELYLDCHNSFTPVMTHKLHHGQSVCHHKELIALPTLLLQSYSQPATCALSRKSTLITLMEKGALKGTTYPSKRW